MKVLIAGAGPGRLAAALYLAQAGIECEVFDSVRGFLQLGVGLNLLPHGAPYLISIIQNTGLFTVVSRVFHVVGDGSPPLPVLFSVFPVFLVCKERNRRTRGKCADTGQREHWEQREFIA